MEIGIGATKGGGAGGAGRGVACIGANAGVARTDAEVVVALKDGFGVVAAGLALNLLRTSSMGEQAAQMDQLEQAEFEVEALLLAVAQFVEGAEHGLQKAS